MKPRIDGPIYIMIAALLWALDGVIRRSLFSLPPITIVFYEHLIGAIILTPVFLRHAKRERMTGNEWSAIIWVSLLSGVLGTLWFTTALVRVSFISFSVVFLLQKLQPVFAIASAKLLLKEKIDRRYLAWAGLAFVAAYFVTFKSGIVNFDTGGGTIVAALFALGAAFAWGSSTAFSRYALLKHTGTFVTTMRFYCTVVLSFFLMLFLLRNQSFSIPSSSQALRLVIIALSTGMVALWIYYRGLKRTQTKIATILELVFPLTAVVIDIFLYKTFLAPSQYAAALVLLFAVYKVSQLNREASPLLETSVMPGKGRGRLFGFPTLNLTIPEHFQHQHGVYAGRVYIDGKKFVAAFHYGPVPVFDQKVPTLEAYLLDVKLETTPERVSFELVRYIREVKWFENEVALVNQIGRDVEETRRIEALG